MLEFYYSADRIKTKLNYLLAIACLSVVIIGGMVMWGVRHLEGGITRQHNAQAMAMATLHQELETIAMMMPSEGVPGVKHLYPVVTVYDPPVGNQTASGGRAVRGLTCAVSRSLLAQPYFLGYGDKVWVAGVPSRAPDRAWVINDTTAEEIDGAVVDLARTPDMPSMNLRRLAIVVLKK